MANEYIRNEAKKHGVFFWEVAQHIGIADTTLSRHMRVELSSVERSRVETAIRDIAANRKREG